MTSTQPLVSVLVPCYNHAAYITECIESILEQDYPNIELIVVDDGSSDDSPQRIEALALTHGFYYERQDNQGLSATLNKMIALSRGQYIAICASDDLYLPHKISTQVALFQAQPQLGLCFSEVLFIKEGEARRRSHTLNARSGYVFSDLLTLRFSCPAVTVMVPRAVYDDVGGFDESLRVEDWDMWLRISHRYPIAYQDEALSGYRLHATNAHHHSERMHAANLQTLEKWRAHPLYEEALLAVNRMHLSRLLRTNTPRALKKLLNPRFRVRRRALLRDGLRRLLG